MKTEVQGVRVVTGHDGQRWEINFDKRTAPRKGEVVEEHLTAKAIPPMVGGRAKGHVTRIPISSAFAQLKAVSAAVPVSD